MPCRLQTTVTSSAGDTWTTFWRLLRDMWILPEKKITNYATVICTKVLFGLYLQLFVTVIIQGHTFFKEFNVGNCNNSHKRS